MNLFFLKTFVDTAKTGSVRATALRHHVTQPAVTQQIRQLEKTLECRLFDRRNRKMVLTAPGKLFLEHAEAIVKRYDESLRSLRGIGKEFRGSLRLATTVSIGLHQLRPIMRRFLKTYPRVEIHLEYHPSARIYELAGSGLIDFGFVAFPKERHDVRAQVFDTEQLVLAQSPDQPVFLHKTIQLKALDRARFAALSSDTPTRRAIDAFLEDHHVFPDIVNEYDNIETLKTAIELGIGCSILPRQTLERELAERTLEVVKVRDLHLDRPLGIVFSRRGTLTETAQAFHTMLMH